MVDVAFGGDGMTEPMLLEEGSTIRNMGTQDARLVRDFIPGQTELSPERKRWMYQYRNSIDVPWNTFYVFSDAVEWLPADFDVINVFTGSSHSHQTSNVLVIKFLRRDKESGGGEEIYGKRMLVNAVVKENLGGKTKVVAECRTEEERVKALEDWFGITLTEEERKAIQGYHTELKNR